ncbi:methyltransferase [Erythrobacter crassostreae]|uniref:Methyltransferase n=1 Tax=Erythrobacter crassostreae TaxID=2828328 RepID=A0A9X1F1H9_9SPHN|nr:class I SAM-dependent methyltransferase [Erythrobacter crassostrea]MBV7258291.1 methyltransferase [Erythrobacter crassostrea]
MSDSLAEHVHYLGLANRSDLYRSAISDCIAPDDTVADLGCGVGVLGIFCLEVGASHVWGIDSSDAIYLAQETVRKAGLDKHYTCIASSTFRAELAEPVDALICDHIGYFGIDYGIIDMVRDAAKRMLKPGGAIMPDKLVLQIAGVSSDACHEKAAAWSDDIVPKVFHWIDEQARNTKYPHEFAPGELCSAPVELGQITLNADTPEYFSFEAEIEITSSGRFDGLAGWFKSHLGNDVWMTNSPLDPNGIKRSQAFFPIARPFDVQRGDRISVTIRARPEGNFLAWDITPRGGPTQKQSNWATTILAEADRATLDGPLRLNDNAQASQYILSLVDGQRTAAQIEETVMRDRPDLMPSQQGTRNLVRDILKRCAVS